MKKTATLNLRVNPDVKKRAEDVLSKLGIPMSTAIDMYLNQISLTGSIPFSISLPEVPDSINAELMSSEEISEIIQRGYNDVKQGNSRDARTAFKEFEDTLD